MDGKTFVDSLVYRAQAVPYDGLPDGTPPAEQPVTEINVTKFHVRQ